MKPLGFPNTARPRCKAKYQPATTYASVTLVRCPKKAGPSGYCRDCDPAAEVRRKAEKANAGSRGRQTKTERRQLEREQAALQS
jgi:hypothetical protein